MMGKAVLLFKHNILPNGGNLLPRDLQMVY